MNTLEELFMVLVYNNPKPLLKKYSLSMKKITLIKNLLGLGACLSFTQLNAQVDTSHFAGKDTANSNFNIPIFSTSGADADSDMDQQDASALLQSSRDVFTQFASFQFGAARYRMRGLPNENQIIMINGVMVNNLENGMGSWSSWGGLNDVTRFVETRFGNTSSRLNFGGAGGYTNIDSKASSFRKGTNVSYASANRIFRHRMMVTHSTGMLSNGWAFTMSASTRQGNQVYIPGTYFNANAFYLGIDKQLNDKHLLSLTAFGAPIEQGRASTTMKEVYNLVGDNYYNSNWGYQNGKVRNASVSKVNRPMILLSHIYNIDIATRLTTSVFYNFGKSSLSGLNWNDAPNARPDYYRYLPSWFNFINDQNGAATATNAWQNDVNTQQIPWDKFIAMNQANIASPQPNQANTNETRARYILENRIENLSNLGFNTVFNKRINDMLFLSAGINANIYKNRRYKEIEDLLGATFWVDVDQFADGLGVDPLLAQNNIDEPNKAIRKGDKFGYDYIMHVNRMEGWGQIEYSKERFDTYFGLTVSNSSIWREGLVANGKFPTTSAGESKKVNYLNYGAKGGLTYKISGRHFITADANFLTRTPEIINIFISPRVRNDLVEGVTQEQVISGDINYLIKYPTLKVRATYYYAQVNNQTQLRTYWNEEFNNFVNYITTDVDQTHQGIELGVEKTIKTAHVLQGALGYGIFYYSNNPIAQAWQDNNATKLFDNRTVYFKNYKVGGSPQTVAGIGYKYNGKKFWFAGINANYFADTYLEPNPDRRTKEAIQTFVDGDPQIDAILKQEKLDNYFLVNLNAGKSWRIKRKYYLRLNGSINNLLNNKNIINWGFESLRWEFSYLEKFPNRYQYMPGTTYMATINFSF